MRVLILTGDWPDEDLPHAVPFLVEQVEHLRAAGVEIEVFSFRGRGRPASYLRAWRELRRRHPWRRFDLVHAHFGQSALLAWPRPPIPLVVTFHGSDLQGVVAAGGRYSLRGRLLQAASRHAARRADVAIVVSRHLGRRLPSGCRFETVPCGIDLERFRPRPRLDARRRLGLDPERRLVLFPADPANPVKRYALARAAVDALPAGHGAELIALRGVDHRRVPDFMNACDALLLTSLHEGSPTVVKEALACGLPVVSVAAGDVAERIAAVDGCELCAADPAALAAALGRVLERGARVDGRSAVAELAHPRITARLIEIYRSLLEPREDAG